jgi:hypothetical protein
MSGFCDAAAVSGSAGLRIMMGGRRPPDLNERRRPTDGGDTVVLASILAPLGDAPGGLQMHAPDGFISVPLLVVL